MERPCKEEYKLASMVIESYRISKESAKLLTGKYRQKESLFDD
jgi:hypothetical protein